MPQATTTTTTQQAAANAPAAFIGLDLGDKRTQLCHLDPTGAILAEPCLRTTKDALRRYFAGQPRWRIILEAGTHSPWIARLLTSLGHEAITIHPRQLRLISESLHKNDRNDARQLATIGRVYPELLKPIEPRSEQTLADRAILIARETAIKARTQAVNCARGLLKTHGLRVPPGATETFPRRAAALVPAILQPALEPLLASITQLTEAIRAYDHRIHELNQDRYHHPTARMRQIPGVGPTTALAFALALDNDPQRLHKSRDAGAFTGFNPIQRDSGDRSPELRISKTGDPLVRRLLVQCAHYILGPFGQDSALRRWGLALAARGGKNAKKRAIVATARKLAVLLHLLWSRDAQYQPFPAGQPV